MKSDIDSLKEKFEKTNKSTEGEMHKKLKWWIAKKYLTAKVPMKKIEFEYKIKLSEYIYTVPDVYIKQWGNVAVYCEIKCDWSFLERMIEKYLPILKNNTIRVVVVFPQNVRSLYPRASRKEFFDKLRELDVDIHYAPYYLDIEKKIDIQLSYDSFNILREFKDKYSELNSIDEFIKNELKNLVFR